jgi:SWI/SNF-related matrix-associated actin-dependent regulator of chromatin subfamily A member 5
LYAELVKPQLELYKSVLLHDIQTDNKNMYLNKLIQLRKISNHAGLCQEDNENELQDLETELILNSGKMVVLDRLLSQLEQEKHKVLLFCQMTRMLDFLEDYCEFRQYKVLLFSAVF